MSEHAGEDQLAAQLPAEPAQLSAELAVTRARLAQLVRLEERARGMQELTAALAAALTPGQIADAALAPALAVLGAHGGGVFLRDPPDEAGPPAGTMTIAGAVGYNAEAVEHWRRIPLDHSTPAGEAVLSGVPLYLGSEAEAAERYPGMFAVPASDRPLGSWAALPLRAGGAVVGALTLSFARRHTFAEDERTFLETVAAQCALSLERARLYETASTERERLRGVLARLDAAYEAERDARAAAEAAWNRLDRLQTITAGLSEAVAPAQVASVMVQGGLSVLGCTSAWIGVLDESGRTLVALAASFPVEPGGPAAQIPLSAASPRAEVTRTGMPVWLPSAAEALERYPGLRAIGIAAGALGVVPLVSHGHPIGAMLLSFDESRELEPEERALVVTLAEQCAQALERARLHQREHDVALTLQQSMLPSALPAVPGLELTGRYRPAVQTLEVGGDWYDVLALSDGRVGLAVGDVVGRGLGAAATMGQLRSALAALALSARPPAQVLDDLELFARQVDGARLGTVVYCLLDPVGGTMRYACAGHPPPLVLLPNRGTEYLEDGRSPLLCALPPELTPRRVEGAYRLPPGSTLLLYSDGLVERRGESLDVGLRRLAELAAHYADRGQGDWCEQLVDTMLAGSGDDDVALLRATFRPALSRRLPAQPQRLAGLRRELRGWLAGVGATDDEVTDLLLACGEACANAVEHAYRDGGAGEVTVELALDSGRELWLRIADTGRWRSVPAPGDRGRGLPLMRAVMDAVQVARGADGTVVTMRRRLGAAVAA
ncbi:MAG: SpoIIE family protein phosphatase [Mycobacteriales bacterium]